MTGKGHIASGAACLLLTDHIVALTDYCLQKTIFTHRHIALLENVRYAFLRVWFPSFMNISTLHIHTDTFHVTGGTFGSVLFVYLSWLLYLVMFFFGALLPDIDTPNSLLGRHFHLPVKHHRITHTVWFMLPFLIGGIWVPFLWWIGVGYFSHLFIDSFGRAGNCWFYPLERYLEYDSGAFVKKGHFLKLYRTGGSSEMVVTCILLSLAIVGIGVRALL